MHIVLKAEYLERYKIRLYFDNGKVKIVDLEGMLKNAKNMFIPLTDLDYFKKVKCDGTTICWPNGVDLCPDVLYEMGIEMTSIPKRTKKIPSAKPQRKSRSRIVNK